MTPGRSKEPSTPRNLPDLFGFHAVVMGTHRLCVAGRSRHKEQAYSPRSRFPALVHGTIEPFCCLGRPYTAQKAIMVASPDRTLSSSHGTLVGDIMWLAVIAFVFAVITGALG